MYTSLLALLPLLAVALAAPLPDGGSAYTGAGGQANGGNIYKTSSGLLNLDLLNFGSDNAGSGGDASSGNAIAGSSCGTGVTQGAGNGGNAYTGVGGTANGGNVYESSDGLLNINALNFGSDNAGSGGDASSGSAIAGSSGCDK